MVPGDEFKSKQWNRQDNSIFTKYVKRCNMCGLYILYIKVSLETFTKYIILIEI